jgi:hypothetical protein
MAGFLNAQFACYVRVNFDPAFQPAWQTKIRLSFFPPGPGRRHIKWYVVNQWFNNNLKRELVAR